MAQGVAISLPIIPKHYIFNSADFLNYSTLTVRVDNAIAFLEFMINVAF
ncbi:hypothetical protein [Scytonema sp. PCC 10023]